MRLRTTMRDRRFFVARLPVPRELHHHDVCFPLCSSGSPDPERIMISHAFPHREREVSPTGTFVRYLRLQNSPVSCKIKRKRETDPRAKCH